MGGMARTKKHHLGANGKTEEIYTTRPMKDKKYASNNCEISGTRNRTLNSIRLLQRSQKNLICLRPFARILKLIGSREADFLRIKKKAIIVLREISEFYLSCILGDANLICVHCGRLTLRSKDIYLVRKIRNENLVKMM